MMRHLLPTVLLLTGCYTTSANVDAGSGDGAVADAAIGVDAATDDGGETDSGSMDAGPGAACDTPGAMEIRPCGSRCGVASHRCEGGVWVPASACVMEGECAAGTFETRTNTLCGEETRLCGETCGWTAWSRSREDGECEAGATRDGDATTCAADERPIERCTEACAWDPVDECIDADGCPGAPRVTPDSAVEVCVAGGPFLYGPLPGVEVDVSAFYIDAYPVTNGRYAACVAAGGCARPAITAERGEDIYDDPARTDHPVAGVTWDQARIFCAWDGGRVLPSEAQWEKAARGPAPRDNRYPWDSGVVCDHVAIRSCGLDYFGIPKLLDRFDALAGTRSHYGTELQFAGGREWTRTWYSSTHPSDPADTTDPEGPTMGALHTQRGQARIDTMTTSTLDDRWFAVGPGDVASSVVTFRCARSASL